MDITKFTQEELWTLVAFVAVASMFLALLFVYVLFLFDKYLWRPYYNQKKPLKYEPGRKD